MPDLVKDWIADGTPSVTPVTSSTPDVPVVDTSVVTTSAAVTTPLTAATAVGSDPATQSGTATPTDTVAAAEQAAKDFIQAMNGDQPFQIPKGIKLPWKRGGEQGFATIEEIQSAHMFERDYRQKTAQVAAERREMHTQLTVARARQDAQERWNAEQADRLAKSFSSPEEESRYNAFLQQYREDPSFKQIVDEARTGRVMHAEQEAIREIHTQDALHSETRAIANAIQQIGAERYPDVDPDRVRAIYAQRLQLDQADISAAAIEQVYQEEAAVIARSMGPVRSELDALKRQLADLTAAKAAAAHNDNTRTAIQRTVNPVASPNGGAAPSQVPTPVAFKGTTLAERGREWSRVR